MRNVTINPAADDGLGVNIAANAAGFVEVSKCHHHSKCKGLKGYCIVAINKTEFGKGSLSKVSKMLARLNKGKGSFTVTFVRAVDAGMERLDQSKDPAIQKKKKEAKKAARAKARAEKAKTSASGAGSKKRKRGPNKTKDPVAWTKYAKLKDENVSLSKKVKELEEALAATNRLQSVMSV